MSFASTLQAPWSRQQFIICLVGVGAVFGVYRLYLASERLPTRTLHRSNAINHSRRRQPGIQIDATDEPSPSITFENPTRDAPFGTLSIHDDTGPQARMMQLRLGLDQMPALRDLEVVSPQPLAMYERVLAAAMENALSMCARLERRPTSEEIPIFHTRAFDQVWSAVRTRNESALAAEAHSLPILLGLGASSSLSQDVIRRFVASETWQLPPGNESLAPIALAADNNGVEPAETEGSMDMAVNGAPNHGLRGLLYYIAEDNAARRAYVHRGIRCEGCGEFPILGVRYHCLNCPDFDLCATCEAHAIHPKNHVFAKIKIPLSLLSQPPKPLKLWYAGDPRRIHPTLDMALKKRLCKETGFDEAELDALYDQFTCIANVPWAEDPSQVAAAIDRRAFNKTMSSDRWTNRFSPNVLLDRMFAFYDTDENSLIGFKEFVMGIEYLRGSNRFASLQRALQGFDIDGDTYVSKDDFLRILMGKFEIQEQLIIDATEGHETERTQGAMEVLRSSQPISSVFNGEDIPPGEERRPRGKALNVHGDVEPVGDEKTLLNDDDPFFGPVSRAPHERLYAAINRFEDMLIGVEQTDGSGSLDVNVESAQLQRTLSQGGGLTTPIHVPETVEEQTYVQDLLYKYRQDGLDALLAPLFARRTALEKRADASRSARQRWRTAIDQYRDKYKHTNGDPSVDVTSDIQTSRSLAAGIVPTDHESLEQREQETSQASLDSLLAASGYGIREDSGESSFDAAPNLTPQAATVDGGNGGQRARTLAPSPLRKMSSISDDNEETTQATDSGAEAHGLPTQPDERSGDEAQEPPAEILRFWAQLDVVDRETDERGGPGKLGLAEVERIVVEDELHEVRALIKSWLELCAL